MSALILPSRRFIIGGLLAAPAIIAANKLMPVKSMDLLGIVNEEEWVLSNYRDNLIWSKTSVLFEYGGKVENILRTVKVPVRTNYRTVHAGTELLKIQNASIIV